MSMEKEFEKFCSIMAQEEPGKALHWRLQARKGVENSLVATRQEFRAWLDAKQALAAPAAPTQEPTAPAAPTQEPKGIAMRKAILAACPADTHPCLPEVAATLLAGFPAYIYGPAGSGKSYMAGQVCQVISTVLGKELEFCDQVAASSHEEVDLLAKIMPVTNSETGISELRSLASPFLRAWNSGGVAFIDEFDALQTATALSLNGALAAKRQFDPLQAKTVACHDDFYFLAAGNTDMRGPTLQYPSRCEQDLSVISRFSCGMFEIGYSRELEIKLLSPQVAAWLWATREKAYQNGLGTEVSTRLGCKIQALVDSGFREFESCKQNWLASLPANERSVLA